MIKFIVLLIFCSAVSAAKYNCSQNSALLILKRPTYEFSVKLLDRVSQATERHFVFSPISTYMQLLALAEGARGNTAREIWNVTRHHRLKCFRRKWKQIVSKTDAELIPNLQKKSLIVLNRLVRPKPAFVREVRRLKSMSVLSLAFNDPEIAAEAANRVISAATSGFIGDTFNPSDFNFTVLLTADTMYYKNNWQIPFNPAYTKPEVFHAGEFTDEVYMMNRMDYFNLADIAAIKARVLELPCGSRERVSMLVFLPYDDVGDVFYNLQKIRPMSIFNTFRISRKKLVNVKLPRIAIRTDIDSIPELLYDMGVKSLFHPRSANLRGISDFKIYASLMTQIAEIEVEERGVRASVADFMVHKNYSDEFIANRPFAYMLVDKKTEIILFAGVYSLPNVSF